jgi:hypothetical protein
MLLQMMMQSMKSSKVQCLLSFTSLFNSGTFGTHSSSTSPYQAYEAKMREAAELSVGT